MYLCMRRLRMNYFYLYRYLRWVHILCFICTGCVISIFLAPPLAKWRRADNGQPEAETCLTVNLCDLAQFV
eukprot:SAG11_NODE_707_length_7651_cov_4.133872_10_plen_71_part_00